MLQSSQSTLRFRWPSLLTTSSCHFKRQQFQLARWASSTPAAPTPKSKPSDDEDEEHRPKPLSRPLGQDKPPLVGENNGADRRTWRQRRDDLFNYDKHLERRKELTKAVAKPYFREWSNMRFHKGKTFQSNAKLFRASKALYFPNLQGITLASPKEVRDTTPVLKDKVSVVSVYSGTWAENQTATFVGQNPDLTRVLKEKYAREGIVQTVFLNVEENDMKAWLIRMFMPNLRKRFSPDAHGRYFVIWRGLSETLREAIGLINSKVGYVYLIDSECRIRWAGSGRAEASEKESLIKGISRLAEELAGSNKKENDMIVQDLKANGGKVVPTAT